MVHGTTTKGAALALHEGLIRPADYTISKDSAGGYSNSMLPTYGFYGKGREQARHAHIETHLIGDLVASLLKIGKGVLPIKLVALFSGKFSHVKLGVGGNDAAMRICSSTGIPTKRGRIYDCTLWTLYFEGHSDYISWWCLWFWHARFGLRGRRFTSHMMLRLMRLVGAP